MIQFNTTTPTSFELVIGSIPNQGMEAGQDVLLQLFGTVVPAIDISSIDVSWMGVITRGDAGPIAFQDWNISFFVNADFSNWLIMNDWVRYTTEGHTTPTEHNINATLSVKNNFGEEVLKILFSDVWIKGLGEVTLNTQDADTFLQSTATLSYGRYDAYLPDEIISDIL